MGSSANGRPQRVACALCIGPAREPYLAATLASIARAVDVLVVNDNSGMPSSDNLATLEESAFGRDGRLRIVRTRFVDFATMRNDAQAMLAALDPAPDWIAFIDADEVHGTQAEYIARSILPRLGAQTAQLDAYTYHFWGTFGWITDIARRMAFYRFSPGLQWHNPVHEKLSGLGGAALVIPYVYHHYGNVLAPRLLAEKHQRYYELGNPVPEPPLPSEATLEMFLRRAAEVRPFRGAHPHAARSILATAEHESSDAFATIDRAFRAARTPGVQLRSALVAANETLRVRLRALEHPGLYRAPLEAQ